MSDLLVEPKVSDPTTDEPEVAHICKKDDVTRAYVTGEPIRALCGEWFVPHRDPDNYPVCQPCLDRMKEILMAGAN